MRIQRRSMKKARIEIIPMIDTIFFLLVFFMISTLSMSQYKGMPVNLPKAASGQQAPAESAAVTINKEGQIFLNKQAVDKSASGRILAPAAREEPRNCWSSSMPMTASSMAWSSKSWTLPAAPTSPRWPSR